MSLCFKIPKENFTGVVFVGSSYFPQTCEDKELGLMGFRLLRERRHRVGTQRPEKLGYWYLRSLEESPYSW